MLHALRLLPLALLVGCADAEVELEHAAYLWQRSWTPAVSAAARAAPVDELRVLALEVDARGAAVRPAVDRAALRGRPLVLVARIDGHAPPPLGLDLLLDAAAAWRAEGLEVRGVEIDHDCATAALGDYADWIARERARDASALRWSITALPDWARARDLPRLTTLVDEVVLQVHAVRAPVLFDAAEARAWLEAFAAAKGPAALRVALPTYRVVVDGAPVAADPRAVQAFLRALREEPVAGLEGVLWYRLPVVGDRDAWSASTLRAVVADAPLEARARFTAVPAGAGRYDLVVENLGNLDAAWRAPRLLGAVEHLELPTGGVVRPGERRTVGWARGEGLRVAD